VVLTYQLFYLLPWGAAEGGFNLRDISLVLIWGGVAWLMFSGARLDVLKNFMSWSVVAYLFLIAAHISLARLYYDQSLVNGIIAARTQFMYVAFFLYMLLLKDSEEIAKLLDYLSVIAVGVLLLSVINYFIPVVFQHWRSEEWESTRAGIARVFIPATPLMNLAAIWMVCRWVGADRSRSTFGLSALFLIGGHFFHQSRGPIFGLVAAVLVVTILTRRFAELRNILIAAFVAGIVITVTLPENILLTPFTTAVEDVSEGTGTVEGRLVQLEHDIHEFMEHPWIGSGLIAIRTSEYRGVGINAAELALATRKADLGYSHWVKMYGLAGILWLGLFLYYLGTRSLRAYRSTRGMDNTVALFAVAYTSFIIITGVTLNHFLIPDRIIVFTLLAAIVVRLASLETVVPAATESAALESSPVNSPPRVLQARRRHVPRSR
jgi:hypothetical protein